MKILITGTHFTPAQAVIEELLGKGEEKTEIVYIGRKYTQEGDRTVSIESHVLPKLGVKFIPLVAGRLRRIFDVYTILSFLKIPLGFVQAFFILNNESPDVILSFGGYVAAPVVFWGFFLNIPVIIHEQTLISGFANRLSSFFADKIAVSFERDYPFKKEKIVLTGNPLREEILSDGQKANDEIKGFLNKAEKGGMSVIYITGGNQGSEVINQVIQEIIEKLTHKAFVIHQTGESKKNYYEKLSEIRNGLENPERYYVKKWFDSDEVGLIYRKSNLAVSRAGVNTLLELAYFGIPAIVIPLPYLYKNEQNVNAKFFAKSGLCQILPQSDLNAKNLLRKIEDLLSDNKKYRQTAQKAKSWVIKDAAQRLALETRVLAHLKKV